MKKRLKRSKKDGKLLGVCAGIANYFDVDPTLVRIIWIIFICCFGTGIIAYFIMALVMPDED